MPRDVRPDYSQLSIPAAKKPTAQDIARQITPFSIVIPFDPTRQRRPKDQPDWRGDDEDGTTSNTNND